MKLFRIISNNLISLTCICLYILCVILDCYFLIGDSIMLIVITLMVNIKNSTLNIFGQRIQNWQLFLDIFTTDQVRFYAYTINESILLYIL